MINLINKKYQLLISLYKLELVPIFKVFSIRFKIILAITLCYPCWITAQINSKEISAYFNNLRLIKSGSYTFNKVYTSPFNKVPTREVYKIWFNLTKITQSLFYFSFGIRDVLIVTMPFQ